MHAGRSTRVTYIIHHLYIMYKCIHSVRSRAYVSGCVSGCNRFFACDDQWSQDVYPYVRQQLEQFGQRCNGMLGLKVASAVSSFFSSFLECSLSLTALIASV